jgi:ketopantoate hydroxymethyltransferase
VVSAVKQYIDEVRAGTFPAKEHGFAIDENILEKLQ